MDMNIQHLRYFIAVAKAGSITSAADELRISQPSLSRQIKIFEDDLGGKLLERGARSIRLTRKGEAVRDEGIRLLRRMDASIQQIRRIVESEVIQVGYAPSLGGELLQRAIANFSQLHPDVRIELNDCSGEEMKAGLLSGALDLCIDVADKNPKLEWHTLLQREIVLAVPTSSELLKVKPNRRVVKVAELEGQRMLFFSRYDYPAAWESVSDYFQKEGVNVKVAGEFDGIASMVFALEAGLGIAMVTRETKFSDKVRKLQLNPPREPVCVSVGWSGQKSLTPVQTVFVEELRRAADD